MCICVSVCLFVCVSLYHKLYSLIQSRATGSVNDTRKYEATYNIILYELLCIVQSLHNFEEIAQRKRQTVV